MTDTIALKFFYDALGVVDAYGETPTRIIVGQRVWEALRASSILEPSDAWQPRRVAYKGAPVYAAKEFAPERVDVTTREETELLTLLNALEVRAKRDTGVPPVAFELGTAKFELFKRAVRSVEPRFHGIPVKHVHKKTDHVGIRYFAPPPEWCVVGACIALKEDDRAWGKVTHVDRGTFHAVVRDLERETESNVSFADLRKAWQRIPDRIVPDSRFLRILNAGPVSGLDE